MSKIRAPYVKRNNNSAETKMVEKVPLNIKKRSAVTAKESSSIFFLFLPSYAEKYTSTISTIIAKEKEKLCSNSYYNSIFSNIKFNIAYTNDRNIKNMIVRTKL